MMAPNCERRRVLQGVLALCMVGACANPGAALDPYLLRSRRAPMNQIVWSAVPISRFDTPAALDVARIVAGEWAIEDEILVATAGVQHRAILLFPAAYDRFRLRFEARLHPNDEGRIGDISVLVNTTADPTFWTSGYALTTGSFYNHCSSFYRLGQHLARTEWSPVDSNRWHRVALAYDRGHIRYWLDDRILLEAWDPSPLPMSADRWIGLRTWNTRMEIRHIKLETPADALE